METIHFSHTHSRSTSVFNTPSSRSLFSVVLVSSAVLLSGCASQQKTQAYEVSGDGTLTVALYKYVPNIEAFKTAVTTVWNELTDAPPIKFVDWDCYLNDPPADLDVFVFDGVYMSHYAESGFLRPLKAGEVSNEGDLLAYSVEGSKYKGTLYGIPQIGCTNILYYRSGDVDLSKAISLKQVYSVLGDATYSTSKPPDGVGFMMDFSGGTTDACTYVAADESYTNNYSQSPPLPPYTDLNVPTMSNLHEMVSMAGEAQAAYSDAVPYQRAIWFNEGAGRAMVGFSEAMSQMGTILPNVEFKEMPLANAAGFSLFYIDIAGVNSEVIGTDDEPWALLMANILASHEVITSAFDNKGNPQYLYPVRRSVFKTLGARYPHYERMYELVQSLNPVAFRLGTDVKLWFKANTAGIRAAILNISEAERHALNKHAERTAGVSKAD